ncbi:sialate O-acetylesterase [Hymenobacter sp. BT770]|uniref:sialate O-acetylesterase n=1 Tax=Hymenobacter sp. BT770 TaxID=2886942 RepID=UPI001D10AC04|nr:sialate O-acetylesterase [Hymenobacter sp. BT770]MCC3153142.1 sialate O-acetylesterase [Hymenobacter sp. BT770]MDO3415384.1 sialate O-acetylesterase [Hymenobacter sp. BT770]
MIQLLSIRVLRRRTSQLSQLSLGLALVGCALLVPATAAAQVRLPRLVSNGMVLQREAPVRIWGWAKPGESVSVAFLGKTYRATTGPNGQWRVTLPAMKAGGPYEMSLTASNALSIKDILVGDVWLCSGQSNMETPMSRLRDKYPDVIAQATNPRIRQFDVPLTYAFDKPRTDLTGGKWTEANPQTVLQFSGVAYFFAKEINAKYNVPVGIIKDAVGGSPAESWLSADALRQFPTYEQQAAKYKDSALVAGIRQREGAAVASWYQSLHQADQGEARGQQKWSAPDYDASTWATMNVPGYWDKDSPLGPVNGVVWFRKEVEVPASMVGQPARLELGTLVDADSTYLNGQLVGTTGYQYPPRKYDVKAGVLKAGKNVVVVRLINNTGRGGFTPGKKYQLTAAGQTLDLRGPWQYKLGATMPPTPGTTTFQYQPGGLFNGMIAPVLPYAIKGVLWYQGESNTGHSQDYQALITGLITDWRKHFQQPNLPFLYAQLPNFMAVKPEPSESDWAALRDAQRRLLAVPHTGMAVLIDAGEWNDIHPLDKQTPGHRLALAAQKVAYGDAKVVASGPLYQTMQVAGNKVTLSFASVGGGLVAKGGGPLKGFAVAGPDKKFVWAQARIEGKKVVVWNDQVPNPTVVRYAWADNPEGANLYNKEGLPASPFTTEPQLSMPTGRL